MPVLFPGEKNTTFSCLKRPVAPCVSCKEIKEICCNFTREASYYMLVFVQKPTRQAQLV